MQMLHGLERQAAINELKQRAREECVYRYVYQHLREAAECGIGLRELAQLWYEARYLPP